MEHQCMDCGSTNVEEIETIDDDELPPEAIVFRTKNSGSGLDSDTVVEAVGYEPSEPEDCESNDFHDRKRFYIRAQAVEVDPERPDTASWWYFTSRDLEPLTPTAKWWLRNLMSAEDEIEKRY